MRIRNSTSWSRSLNNISSETAEVAETRVTLKNVGKIDPTSIDEYIAGGGYGSLEKILSLPRTAVIDELIASSLRGRGGAGFSAGLKERFTNDASTDSRPTYIVCNADEGEPGTFKDRIIMENDPHLLIEGILIAAYAIGAQKAFIYIRAEYHESIERVSAAITSAREHGFVGPQEDGTGFSVEIDVSLGAGSYLCGEELTLLESLEGKRGYPRIKPPYPAENGLFGCPTLVNNVETLATIPTIIEKGSAWYLELGTAEAPGTKIFTLSGDVQKPGYYEVEFGTTIRELIYTFGGGISDGAPFQAALLGGAAGTFVDESVLDTETGYDSLKKIGAVVGSGAVIVISQNTSILSVVRSILRFFAHESCGKCVPCRIGTNILVQLMDRVIDRELPAAEGLEAMVAEARYMDKTSLCPLGQSPLLPLRSLLRYFGDRITR